MPSVKRKRPQSEPSKKKFNARKMKQSALKKNACRKKLIRNMRPKFTAKC
jgi:hypothetical protein